MNRWAVEGGNPFSGAKWHEAWKVGAVDKARWQEIRDRLREEVYRWQKVLQQPRDLEEIELSGIVGSVAHLDYHLGAIRQIHATARGPKEDSAER